ncbi:UNVERIFIED_CONTAM: hypothetical protein Slati_4580100 [Sesamum latifolium]|uniref:Retrovirus-related Pol polyprotein from transposon TNT 1-94-like beta-barrel domain-containing protein n=1 Tax=Sesamum latifolium TaxID=2727402 RepID=A0AAW2S3Y3_9LAMI
MTVCEGTLLPEAVAPPTLLPLATAPIVVEPIMSLKNVGSNMVYQNGLILLTVEVSLHWNLLPQSEAVTLSREEYEQLLNRPIANSATPATAFSPGAFVASHGESWMLDSSATTFLTDNRSHFSSLSTSHTSLPVRLADGSYSPISGSGTVQPTNHLTVTNVLFAPKFPVNLLFVSQLTKKHNCSVTFFPSYCVFQDLQTRRTIGRGHELGGLYFLDPSTHVDVRALSASIFPLQCHCRLGHPFLPSLKKSYLLSHPA